MKRIINKINVIADRMSDQAYFILDNINVSDVIEFGRDLPVEVFSIREELPDFGFRYFINNESSRCQLWFALDGLTLRKFKKNNLSELCELLPDIITTKHFRFKKSDVRYINALSKPCKCCGHVKNIPLYYLTFDIEKI